MAGVKSGPPGRKAATAAASSGDVGQHLFGQPRIADEDGSIAHRHQVHADVMVRRPVQHDHALLQQRFQRRDQVFAGLHCPLNVAQQDGGAGEGRLAVGVEIAAVEIQVAAPRPHVRRQGGRQVVGDALVARAGAARRRPRPLPADRAVSSARRAPVPAPASGRATTT